MVRAKFRVSKIEDGQASQWRDGQSVLVPTRNIKLHPVCDGTEENKRFFASTPGGEITLGCANLAAVEQFREGQEFYIDFVPVGEKA